MTTLVDAPCGDFNWMAAVDLAGINYTGIDIVPEIVERNRQRYAGHRFEHGDITRDPLPDNADLMICRDCLFHLPFANIADWMENVARARPRTLMVTTHPRGRNLDIDRPGRFRLLDLTRKPFRFPVKKAPDRVRDSPDDERPRFLFLFSREDYEPALSPEAIAEVRGHVAPFANHRATAHAPDGA